MTYAERIRAELERARAIGELIRLHCNDDDLEAFDVGTVADSDADSLALWAIDSYGQPDGIRTVRLDAVRGVTTGGEYLRRIRYLGEHALPTPKLLSTVGTRELLEAARDAQAVVSLRYSDGTFQGRVTEVGEDWAVIDMIGEDGTEEGLRILDIDFVERVFADGADERRLELLSSRPADDWKRK